MFYHCCKEFSSYIYPEIMWDCEIFLAFHKALWLLNVHRFLEASKQQKEKHCRKILMFPDQRDRPPRTNKLLQTNYDCVGKIHSEESAKGTLWVKGLKIWAKNSDMCALWANTHQMGTIRHLRVSDIFIKESQIPRFQQQWFLLILFHLLY